jgi:hypothetical protein
MYVLHTRRSPVRNTDRKFKEKLNLQLLIQWEQSNWTFLLRRAAEHMATSCNHTLKGEIASAQHRTTAPT